MLQNRVAISQAEIDLLINQRNTIYIPTTINLIADNNEEGAPNAAKAIEALCNLNSHYAPYGIQYFFNPNKPIQYIKHNPLYNDAVAYLSDYAMGALKEYNVFNLYIGKNVSINILGYYSLNYDFVWVKDDALGDEDKALPHEVGHFWTLAHTFSGWENVNYQNTFLGQNAPSTIGGEIVENQARDGYYANCNRAGDGFCDTPADYFSFRKNCIETASVIDPLGEVSYPNMNNYMSYFYPQCLNTFTPQQVNAIYASIIARGWQNIPRPQAVTLQNNFTSMMSPLPNESLNYNYNNPFHFVWKPTINALGYVFQLERINPDQSRDTIDSKFIEQNLFIGKYISNKITQAGHYRWSLQAIDAYNCSATNTTEYYDFYINMNNIVTAIDEIEIGQINAHNITVFSNPIERGNDLFANISTPYNTNGNISLYDINGRTILKEQIELMADNDNIFHCPNTQTLSAGMYILQVKTKYGIAQSKVLIR